MTTTRVPSRAGDGTEIAVEISGQGPPLVLVHGTSSSAARWLPVRPSLEARFTLHIVERRGRGASTDGASYELGREVDDLLSVIDAVGAPCDVLGHSFGGLISLEATRRASAMGRLVVYEPPVPVRGVVYPPGVLARFEALLAEGHREEVVVTFFRDVLRVDDAALARTRALASWPARVLAAHTLPREVRATDGYTWDPRRFADVRIPVSFLYGGASAPIVRELTFEVAAAFPVHQVRVLEGQGHAAMDTAPDLFVETLSALLP